MWFCWFMGCPCSLGENLKISQQAIICSCMAFSCIVSMFPCIVMFFYLSWKVAIQILLATLICGSNMLINVGEVRRASENSCCTFSPAKFQWVSDFCVRQNLFLICFERNHTPPELRLMTPRSFHREGIVWKNIIERNLLYRRVFVCVLCISDKTSVAYISKISIWIGFNQSEKVYSTIF